MRAIIWGHFSFLWVMLFFLSSLCGAVNTFPFESAIPKTPLTLLSHGSNTIAFGMSPSSYTLNFSTEGQGYVVANPQQTSYAPGSWVTLLALTTSGYVFQGWSGDASGSSNPILVQMDRNKSITAIFSLDPKYGLPTVFLNNTNAARPIYYLQEGVLVPSNGDIQVELLGGPLTGDLKPVSLAGTTQSTFSVNLKDGFFGYGAGVVKGIAAMDQGRFQLRAWRGATSYDLAPERGATPIWVQDTGSWNLVGSASGTPLCVPSSIVVKPVQLKLNVSFCGKGTAQITPYKDFYLPGETVQIVATAADGYVFDSWNGDSVSTNSVISILMDADKQLTAILDIAGPKAIVLFNNLDPVFKPIYYGSTNTLAPAGDTYIEILGGPVGSTLAPVKTMSPKVLFVLDTPGTFDKGAGIVSGVAPGQMAEFQIRAWRGASNFDRATEKAISPHWHQTTTMWDENAEPPMLPDAVPMQIPAPLIILSTCPAYTISSTIDGNGSVTITPLKSSYLPGEVVLAKAIAAQGTCFDQWAGDVAGNINPFWITFDANKTITAKFTNTPLPKLSQSIQFAPLADKILGDPPVGLSATASSGLPVSFQVVSGPAILVNSQLSFKGPGLVTIRASQAGNSQYDPAPTVDRSFSVRLKITLSVSGAGSITREPDQISYSAGDTVKLTAIPVTNAAFQGWAGSITGTKNPIILVLSNNLDISAVFTGLYRITINKTGLGDVTLTPQAAGYQTGTTVQLTAQPAAGWDFVQWSGAAAGTSAVTTVVVNGDQQVNALFKQRFALTSSVQGQGTILVDPQQTTYLEGSIVTLKAAAATNYQFVYWIGNVANSNSATTTTILSTNRLVTAVFLPYYRLDTVATNGGAITRSPDQTNYLAGATVALTAVPDDYHTFANWSGSVTGTNNPVSFSMDKSKTVIANFVSNYFLTIITNGQGIVERSPIKNRYSQGEQVRLAASPLAGYGFGGWSGALSGTNAVAYLAMNADKSVTASFKPLRTLQIDIDGSGSVAQDPYLTQYLDGSTVQLTAAPTNGWQFVSWLGGITSSNNPVKITLTSNVVARCLFKPIFRLTTNVVGSGSIVLTPAQSNYLDGSIVQAQAQAANGYSFTGWTGDVVTTNNPIQITMLTNKNLTATFTHVWNLSATSSVGGIITQSPSQSNYLNGTTVLLSALADWNYQFMGWTGSVTGN